MPNQRIVEYIDPNYETSPGNQTGMVRVKPKGGGEFGHVQSHGDGTYTARFHPTNKSKKFNDGVAAHKWLIQTDKDDWAERKKSDVAFVRKFGPKHVNEEAPVNAVGGGNIAGIGIGPQGEPAGKLKKPRKRFKAFVKESLEDQFEPYTYSKGKKFIPPYSQKNSHTWAMHDNVRWGHTGKTGEDWKTGEPAWEYSHKDDKKKLERRVWIDQAGKITEE